MWLNLYILIFIILSFFSPTFNHTHYRDVRAIRIDVEPKVRSKVFNFDGGESVAHGAANLQEIERVTLLRSETVHEPQFERAIECCRLRDNQLTVVVRIRPVDRDDQPPFGRLLIVAENGQSVGRRTAT